MFRGIIISFLMLLPAACSVEHHDQQELWRVRAVSSAKFPVLPGMIMMMANDSVTFIGKEQSFTYAVLITKDRVVLGTGDTKMLFSMKKTGDTALLLQELYALQPLTIAFSAETNLKK